MCLISLLQNPPNFLRASALSEHISPVVVIPAEVSSPDSEPVLEKDDLMDMDASQQVETPFERNLALLEQTKGQERLLAQVYLLRLGLLNPIIWNWCLTVLPMLVSNSQTLEVLLPLPLRWVWLRVHAQCLAGSLSHSQVAAYTEPCTWAPGVISVK